MTNFQAISAELYPYSVDDELIDKVCIDTDMDAMANYVQTQKIVVAKAVIVILEKLISLSSENNGGYALTYDVNSLRERIYTLASDNGLTDIAGKYNNEPSVISYTSW